MLRKLAGIIFVAGEEGVTLNELSTLLNLSHSEIKSMIEELQLALKDHPLSPIDLVKFGDRFLYVTQPDLEPLIENFAQSPLQQKLSRPAIETLAIVAYRQPITRMTIDEIRGVSSQAMLQKLVSRDLIKEVGKLEAPGRPILYGVTDYFLNYFALSSLEDLPPIEDLALNSQTASEELFSLKKWEINLFDHEE
ncbi:SMC-Scp complex subunit ScpB [Facklamia sp. 7083-14-GEN3]|uniref:SMC-Scp complex subunit ScpB n=1 Tax=Facklamia sp. 7083-14-GEN3 TaxID=2973478 RepID=UPI00215C1110|nr:SMC-Scp complex subunit ScpB [Facklamia sp. 7083-14-GEN3]MCR8968973.1 SMC-Scp complex subunit ScpB [Facklamia sp. 7083-14-GEN3]